MKISIEIGGVRFHFDSDCDIIVGDSFAPFLGSCDAAHDVSVRLIHDFTDAPLPRRIMAGEDLLMKYYHEEGGLLCMTKSGRGEFLASCLCSPDLRELTVWFNFRSGDPVDTLAGILRMIPMRRILLQHGVLFLHASQIAVGNTGILFSAPSGTGKTTQAKLWKRFRGAELLCNDRTLTDCTMTYGFPFDGSEPVLTGERRRLGAVVILRQAPENTVRRLLAREALPLLMSQTVLDTWDSAAQAAAGERMLDLISKTPVYLLACTPDEQAVQCLEQQLWKDGVIPNE